MAILALNLQSNLRYIQGVSKTAMTTRRQAFKTFAVAAAAGATWFDAFASNVRANLHTDFAGLPMGIQSYSYCSKDCKHFKDLYPV